MKGTKVYVAQKDETLRGELCSMFRNLELEVVGSTGLAKELVEACTDNRPDLVVTAVHLEDGCGLEALLKIAKEEPLPAIVVAKQDDLEDVEKAMQDHVMAFLIDPVDQRGLRSTSYLVMRRFEQFQELRKENSQLKEALESRKKMERAKGIIMEKYDLTEEEAYLRIRKVATNRRMKLSEVADIVIEDATAK